MAVYKDKNGTWYLSVRYVNWQGEHARKVKCGFATKREATEWERNFLMENAGNLDMPFETFVEIYKKNLRERIKLSTWQTKESIIDTKILPYFKNKRMNDIKVSDIVAWQNTMLNMVDENGAKYSPVYLKTIHNQLSAIEYYEDRHLDKAQILRFAACKFIDEGPHIILKGASGNGKTYLACALGNAACRRFKTVRYIRMPELLEDLALARAERAFPKAIQNYKKVDLLILDEWLIRRLTPQESYDLLELTEARCKDRSMIFCTQYEPEGWYDRINPESEGSSTIDVYEQARKMIERMK